MLNLGHVYEISSGLLSWRLKMCNFCFITSTFPIPHTHLLFILLFSAQLLQFRTRAESRSELFLHAVYILVRSKGEESRDKLNNLCAPESHWHEVFVPEAVSPAEERWGEKHVPCKCCHTGVRSCPSSSRALTALTHGIACWICEYEWHAFKPLLSFIFSLQGPYVKLACI